jgi:adenine-specific DNA-methyltransferase
MAKVEDLIKNIPDAKLRDEIAREVAQLKAEKKFGLVFEEHIPELAQLPSLPPRVGDRVCKRGGKTSETYRVVAHVNSRNLRIAREPDGEEEDVPTKEVIVVKRFGEPIYPALVPVDRVTRAPGKPYHTIINADNYHALQLLLYTCEGQVDVIYIDPPYNTGARDWKYNNDYVDANDQWRHSKWLSMIKKRLLLAKRLLKRDGVLIVTIDDNEYRNLGVLLDELFPDMNHFSIVIEHNKRGRQGEDFAKTHEYAIFLTPINYRVIAEEKTDSTIGGETRNLRRTGNNSLRSARWKQFYPFYVNEETLEIVGVGDSLSKAAKRSGRRISKSVVPIWPIDKQGVERNWHFGVDKSRKWAAEKRLEARRQDYGIQIYHTLRQKESKKYKTVWSRPALDASTYGSELLTEIMGKPAGFSYPKSVYAVTECLIAACGLRPNALILDFFAGSGTTFHATALLNAEDGGNRRCILVTNNEVNDKLAKELNEQGYFPGDDKFEEHGICESVTFPRCKYVVNGKRDDSTELPGAYLSGREMKEGFEENLEYFRLDFLDPHHVAYGDKFEAIVPILWLMAGAHGERETARGYSKWFIPRHSPYAVLIEEDAFTEFKRELKRRPDITHIFLVTDSEDAYHEMIADLPGTPQTKMLYKSYLDNFKINTEKNLG